MSLTITEYFKLTKPGVLYLLMITAGASMVLATNFNLNFVKALTGFIGIALIAGSSAAINQILEFKYDGWLHHSGAWGFSWGWKYAGKIFACSATS